jgi:quinol-cytochrome oxidoreductase complex cytochrome b subunit
MNNILYSITWLAISLIPPFIVYFVTRKSKGRQTSNKTTKIYLLIFIFAIISSTLIYSLFDTLYLSLIILFILGVLALIYLIHNQNSIKDEHHESEDKE